MNRGAWGTTVHGVAKSRTQPSHWTTTTTRWTTMWPEVGQASELSHIIPFSLSAAAAKSLQSCPTLCNPIDGSPPGSPVPGILQARTLEWVAISFSKAWKWKVKVKSLSCVQLLATPWTAAYQTPPSMGFSRQEYWSGVPLPSPILFLQKRINIFRVTTMRSNLPPERIKGQKEKIQLKQILTGASLKIGSTI